MTVAESRDAQINDFDVPGVSTSECQLAACRNFGHLIASDSLDRHAHGLYWMAIAGEPARR